MVEGLDKQGESHGDGELNPYRDGLGRASCVPHFHLNTIRLIPQPLFSFSFDYHHLYILFPPFQLGFARIQRCFPR